MALTGIKFKDKQELFVLLQKAFFLNPKNTEDAYSLEINGDDITVTWQMIADYEWDKVSGNLKKKFRELIEDARRNSMLGTIAMKFKKQGSEVVFNSADRNCSIQKEFCVFNKQYMEMLEILSFRSIDQKIVRDLIVKAFPGSELSFRYVPKDTVSLRIFINSKELPLGDIDVSSITDFSYAFSLQDGGSQVQINKRSDFSGLEKWDTSKAVNMLGMFAGCENFDYDISMWDTSKVTDMSVMFASCKKFNQNISVWDTSSCTKMKATFYKCENFDQDLSSWDTSQVKDMSLIFAYCRRLSHDLHNLDTHKVTSDDSAFLECPLKEEFRPQLPGNDFKRQYYEKYVGPNARNYQRSETLKKVLLCVGFVILVVCFSLFGQGGTQ
ncbi:MAG TPA: hypothetical protein DCR21_07430 [Succinivibrionaceae bacterium]|nr:DUF285 domain-containing protein [Succinivibrio sp.]HAR80646.1 hypothetical protein [Succinivibrionaceae bacterium]